MKEFKERNSRDRLDISVIGRNECYMFEMSVYVRNEWDRFEK